MSIEFDDHQYEKVGFDIGWDYYSNGLQILDDVPKCVWDGYYAAKEKRVVHKPDRWTQKWLYMRMSAYKRKRIVASHVTPKLIKILDEGWCPITRRKLTYSTGLDTDWSLDRVNNDGAYAISNICVMSVKANLIKGSLNSEDINQIVRFMLAEKMNIYNGLTFFEWRRLNWVTQKCSDDLGCPMVTPAPPFIQLDVLDVLQSFMLLHCFYPKLEATYKFKKVAGPSIKTFKKLFKTMATNVEVLKHMGNTQCVTLYDLYQLPHVFGRLLDVFDTDVDFGKLLDIHDKYYIGKSTFKDAEEVFQECSDIDFKQTWRTDSKGYLDGTTVDDSTIRKYLDLMLPKLEAHL